MYIKDNIHVTAQKLTLKTCSSSRVISSLVVELPFRSAMTFKTVPTSKWIKSRGNYTDTNRTSEFQYTIHKQTLNLTCAYEHDIVRAVLSQGTVHGDVCESIGYRGA